MNRFRGYWLAAALAAAASCALAGGPPLHHAHRAAKAAHGAREGASGGAAAQSTASANREAAAALAAAQADRDFLVARDLFRAGDSVKLDKLAPSLEGHVLAPYVRYWQLKLHIDDADAVAIRSFLATNKDSLLAERLRNDWLKSLGKRGSWELFAQEYPLAQDE